MERDTAGTNAAENEREEKERDLVAVMAALADGDGAAIFTLREQFRPELARAVRSVAAKRGARLSADDVDELITEVALVMYKLAKAWDPERGAPPWVWAHHRVAEVVDRHIGQWTTSLDALEVEVDLAPVVVPAASAGSEPRPVDVAERLAAEHTGMALVCEALEKVASPRDRELFFEVLVQASLGDRSAAATVGQLLGVSPEAVRQQMGRIRRRIRDLAESDPHFADLAELAVVA